MHALEPLAVRSVVARDREAIKSMLEASKRNKERNKDWYTSFATHVELALNYPNYVVLVGKRGSRIVGAATLHLGEESSEDSHRAELSHTLVEEGARHAGISRKFILARLIRAKRKGYKRAFTTLDNDPKVISLYESFGFQKHPKANPNSQYVDMTLVIPSLAKLRRINPREASP